MTSRQEIFDLLAVINEKLDKLADSNRDDFPEEEDFVVKLDSHRELRAFEHRLEGGLKNKLVVIDFLMLY